MDGSRRRSPSREVVPVDDVGLDGDYKEAGRVRDPGV